MDIIEIHYFVRISHSNMFKINNYIPHIHVFVKSLLAANYDTFNYKMLPESMEKGGDSIKIFADGMCFQVCASL